MIRWGRRNNHVVQSKHHLERKRNKKNKITIFFSNNYYNLFEKWRQKDGKALSSFRQQQLPSPF